MEAGRLTIRRLDTLEAERKSFAFESTLASYGLATRLARLRAAGYTVHIVYLWLPRVELALARVAERVRVGGHDVSAVAVRRRFQRGRDNFFSRYRFVADKWYMYDASTLDGPRLVAEGERKGAVTIHDEESWQVAAAEYANE